MSTRRISILEAQPIQQVKEPNSPPQNNCTQSSTDELIIGVQDKVTRFVLSKIDNELDKLLSNKDHAKDNPVVVSDFSEPIKNDSKVDQPSSQNTILTPTAKSLHRDNNHFNRKQHHVNTSYTNGSEENHVQYRTTPLQISQKTEIQHTGRKQITTNPSLQQFKPYIPLHQNLATSRQNCKVGQPIFYTTPNESDNHFFIHNRPKLPNQLID
ncbi:unnamed protein product [Mytilus coruscus]|uniref:Uncharacterized protein n=1 Tax=Mytilus coruscus TaxID=42192 RepID=A0A6J8EE20_MYTCO|nr:unnamed protein product [Mytilus coruscus]